MKIGFHQPENYSFGCLKFKNVQNKMMITIKITYTKVFSVLTDNDDEAYGTQIFELRNKGKIFQVLGQNSPSYLSKDQQDWHLIGKGQKGKSHFEVTHYHNIIIGLGYAFQHILEYNDYSTQHTGDNKNQNDQTGKGASQHSEQKRSDKRQDSKISKDKDEVGNNDKNFRRKRRWWR